MPTVAAEEAPKKRRGRRPAQGPRRDPASDSKRIDYSTAYDAIVKADPERKYVAVDPNSEHMGPGFYEAMGYKQEIYEGPESPRFARFRVPEIGKPVAGLMGTVLMSIDFETWDWIRVNGVDGKRGQKLSDRRDARMLKNRREKDGFRGLAGDLAKGGYAETGISEGEMTRERFRVE